MRAVRIFFLLCLFLALAAPAQAARPGFAQRAVQKVQAKTVAFRAKLRDPAQRKKIFGKAGLTAAGVAVGQGLDIVLMAHGIPPLATTLLSSAIPTMGQSPAQRALHKLAPKWFDKPPERGVVGTLVDGAFAGVVGVGGGAIVDHASKAFGVALPGDRIAAALAVGRKMSVTAVKKGVALAGSALKQGGNQVVSDLADRGRALAGQMVIRRQRHDAR
jgi:hypothetical protein